MGMLKAATIVGGIAHVKLALTIMGCPLKNKIREDVETALLALEGVEQVNVLFDAMSPDELQALREKLGANKAAKINSQSAGGGINRLEKKVPYIIAVTSGKGGVGKSSVTAQLATAFTRRGQITGILDADITGPSIARIFGTREKPGVLDEKLMIPVPTASGVRILSMNLLIENETEAVIWRGPVINGAIRQLYADAVWEGVDVLLIDLPPGTSDANLTVFQSIPVDGIITVTSPQTLVKMIVSKAVSMAEKLGVPVLGLVENLAYIEHPDLREPLYPFGRPRGEETARELSLPFLGSLPIQPELAEACDSGTIHLFTNSKFDEIAGKLLDEKSRRNL